MFNYQSKILLYICVIKEVFMTTYDLEEIETECFYFERDWLSSVE